MSAPRRLGISAAAALCAAVAATSGIPRPATAAAPPRFDAGRILAGQGGGEPSLAVDLSPTASRNHVYVEAIGGWGSQPPPGAPAGAGPVIWRSADSGATFSTPVRFDQGRQDAATSGGDGDVVVDAHGHVIVTDLNITYTWVQVSTDHGATFDAGTPTAPEDDRPWLTASGDRTVYVAYHDFVAEDPVVCTSTDGGQTFPACDPFTLTSPGTAVQCAENTIPARSLSVDPADGSLNFLFSCSTAAENVQHPPYGPLHDYYLAQSRDGGLTWTDFPVFLADTSGGRQPNYANIFSTLGIDSAGDYYVVFAGTADDPHVATNPYHVWLVTSRDHGHTWSAPVKVDTDVAGTHTEPHFVVTSPGNIDVVYYRTTATGEPNGYCGQFVTSPVRTTPCSNGFARYDNPSPRPPLLPPPSWEVDMAQSTNALSASPSFTQVALSRNVHVGEICTNGIVCGASDRSLLDFMSVGADCNGLAHIAFAGNTPAEERKDFSNGGADIHEVNQVGGQPLGAPAACGSGAAPGGGGPGGGGPPPSAPPEGQVAAATSSEASTLPNTGAAVPSGVAGLGALLGVVAAARRRRRRGPGAAPRGGRPGP